MFRSFMNTLTIVILAGFLWTLQAFGQENGKVTGILVDAENGDPLIGANVVLDGTSMGAASSLDGSYVIPRVPAGVYTLKVSHVSYQETRVSNVRVVPGQVTRVDVSIKPESIQGEEVVVEARLIQNNESSLLKSRQMAVAVSDAISSEAISRAGTGDAAGAMTKVTGASVVGGKYVFVRGLGDRYSSTQMNGVELPSSDPDKKAFQLDLIPSNLLDNITTIKTFTPDKPGSFSGGLVDINTKAYPDKLTFKVTSSLAYNSQATFNKNFLKYAGSSTDWLGFDNGQRDLPSFVANNSGLPDPTGARRNASLAYQLDEATRSFSKVVLPQQKAAPLNGSFGLSVGNQIELGTGQLGYIGSLSYSRAYRYYDHGKIAKWELSGRVQDADELDSDIELSDSKGVDEVLWGGVGTLSYKFHRDHEITGTVYFSQSGEATTRYQKGIWYDQMPQNVYETRSLLYTERNLTSYQIRGEHHLASVLGSIVNWSLATSATSQDEPDLRYFSDHYTIVDTARYYEYIPTGYYNPSRIFRYLDEDALTVNGDLTVPFRPWSGLPAKLKFGGAGVFTDRRLRERRYEFSVSGTALRDYHGSPDGFVDQIGIIDSSNGYRFGRYVIDASEARGNYNGTQDVTAGYAMIELPVSSRVRLVGGTRYETTKIILTSKDPGQPRGGLDEGDLLPSAGFIFRTGESMNVRLSYGRTLARPTFRELAPYQTFEYIGDYTFVGNPDLKRTLIDNYDSRWEWFVRPGELLAAGLFYKKFRNPIERTFIIGSEGVYQYQNVDQGRLYGMELEVRKRLDEITPVLGDFSIGFNLSLVHSEVDIPKSEYEERILPFDSSAKKTRPLFGQSPYLINADLGYQNPKTRTTVNLQYNVFGRRLAEVAIGAAPDVYEEPRHDVTLTVSQKLLQNFEFKGSIRNMLDQQVRKVSHFKGRDFVYQQYSTGRTITMGLSYSL